MVSWLAANRGARMATIDDDLVLRQRVRVMQIILLALVIGCLSFMMIAVVVRQQGGMNAVGGDPIISYIAIVFAAIMLMTSIILSRFMTSGGRMRIIEYTKSLPDSKTARDEAGDLYALYQTRMIVTAAPLEGAVFFLLSAYMIEGNLWTLVTAVVMVAVLISKFPTFTRLDRWVQEQKELLQQERMGI